jgi:4-diphosphocytidyl-2-C-methyl-D-erythritol kinase
MSGWRARAPGKVNLTLFVARARPDGYHPLASVVQPLSLADELRLEPAPDEEHDVVECPGVEGENLALRALSAYRETTGWRAPPQRLIIEKHVPVAAGMGGGSADAAAALRLAAAAARRPEDPLLAELAPTLGADVPALLEGRRVLMTGVGEVVEPLPGHVDAEMLIVPGEQPLSTPEVYSQFDRLGLGRDDEELEDLASQIRADGGGPLTNDLQRAAVSLCPAIAPVLDAVRAAGADQALVSGSGPTVVGIFIGEDRAQCARAAAEALPRATVARPVGPAFGAARPT